MAEFLDMGGYAAFIWPAYGAVAAVLAGIWFASKWFVSSTEAELEQLNPRKREADDET